MYKVGFARADMTPNCSGVGMMGWGDATHRVKGVSKPLFARAAVIEDAETRKRLIFACADLCFVTEALRDEVLVRLSNLYPALAIQPEELILTATHTHNAPGGHSKYLLYGITVPGFQPHVFEIYSNALVEAIVAAFGSAQPAHMRLASAHFDPDSKVAFNRSLKAWSKNPEARPEEEIDREMTLIRFDGLDAKALGSINWFSVHATSIHRAFPYIHPDNKGVAAELMEQELAKRGSADFVAIFAQGAAGDVTPNFVKYFGLQDVRGAYRDDERSCQFNAELQCDMALRIFDQAADVAPIEGAIDCAIEKKDFSNIEADAEFAFGRSGMKTGPAGIGCNFLKGTREGNGAPGPLVALISFLAQCRRYARYLAVVLRGKRIPPPWRLDPIQGPKIIFMESGRGRILGFSRLAKLNIFDGFHPMLKNMSKIVGESYRERKPFTPQVLPIQVVRIGPLAFIAVPAEFTTVAGRRLKETVLGALSQLGTNRVITCGFSNAYSGYVTTYEEFQVQAYEGASTHFGMWTLAAYQTVFKRLCLRMVLREQSSQKQNSLGAA